MPGWHKALKKWVDSNELVVLGVVQEQHSERTRLYKQWRQLNWPIVQDAFNLLQIKVVPMAIAIDENGVVRSDRARPSFVKTWMETEPFDLANSESPDPLSLSHRAAGDVSQLMSDPNAAIESYDEYLAAAGKDDPRGHFEAAVAYRMRYDKLGRPEDFQSAIDHWYRALEIDPNHYIYRRRIQQYGARLGKPYPFYDWVAQAQSEIEQRGESPVELTVPLSGAEIASPTRKFDVLADAESNPDPNSKINTDTEGLVDVNVVVVPHKIKPGAAARVHVLLQPGNAAKWNNEAEPTQLWVDGSAQAAVSRNLMKSKMPGEPESTEPRRFELEVQMPKNAEAAVSIPAFALFTICRSDNGVCILLRKNIEIEIDVDRR